MAKDERLIPMQPSERPMAIPDYPASYPSSYDSTTEGISFRQYFNIVYKRLWLILTLITLVTAATAFYMYRLPSVYEARTVMILEPPKPKNSAKEININFGNDLNYTNTQLKLLQNPELMKKVVIKLGLYRDPNLFNQGTGLLIGLQNALSGNKSAESKTSTLPVLTQIDSSASVDNAATMTPEENVRADNYANSLVGGLLVEQVLQTNLVNIKVASSNADLTPKVADGVAQVFIEEDIKRSTQNAEKTNQDLTKNIDDLKNSIAQSEQARLNYLQSKDLPLQTKGQDLVAERLSKLSTMWLEAENNRVQLQNRYQSALHIKAQNGIGAVPDVNENQQVATAKLNSQAAQSEFEKHRLDMQKRLDDIDKELAQYISERQELRVKYTDEYPPVIQITAKIELASKRRIEVEKDINKRLTDESSKRKTDSDKIIKDTSEDVLNSLKAKYDAAAQIEAKLKSDYFQERASANQQGQDETRLTTLNNEIDTNRTLLSALTQRQKETELAINSSRPDNITISTPASAPSLIGPQRNRNILIGFLMSLAAGIGLAFLLDYLDDSIKSSDDISRSLGLPTLALIPHQNLMEKKKRPLTLGAGGESSTALISLEDNRSPAAEAYRHLRTSLLFSSAGKPPQTILITSSQPSEGKTTTAINTAITLAQSGVEVILMDCDLRRPRLHHHFNLENTHGLTNYLSGERNQEKLLKPVPQLPNLKIITSGPIPPNPAELLSSNEMRLLLEFLKSNHKHIVIDSPPAISFTDAAILSTLVDGVVLVAMAGKSSVHLMRRFKQRLSHVGARVYGVVLNGLKANSLDYSYYGYGYGSYYSSYEDANAARLDEPEEIDVTKN